MKLIYRCEPCNFEHEHLYFSTSPYQAPIPDCPFCGKALVEDVPEPMKEYHYVCTAMGCGHRLDVEMLATAKAPKKRQCTECGKKTMEIGIRPGSFAILHGNSSKASFDVIIGRDSEKRWEQINERQEQRNKIRRETGSTALTATGQNEYRPIKGGRLESVVIPEDKVNPGEKM